MQQQLANLRNTSQDALLKSLAYNPICKQGQECVGWGVDATSGRTAHPLLSLNFSGSQQKWHGYKSAAGMIVQGVDVPDFQFDTKAFKTFDAYKEYVLGTLANNQGRGGSYATDLSTVYTDVFQTSTGPNTRDSGDALTQARYDLYFTKLLPSPSTPSRTTERPTKPPRTRAYHRLHCGDDAVSASIDW